MYEGTGHCVRSPNLGQNMISQVVCVLYVVCYYVIVNVKKTWKVHADMKITCKHARYYEKSNYWIITMYICWMLCDIYINQRFKWQKILLI